MNLTLSMSSEESSKRFRELETIMEKKFAFIEDSIRDLEESHRQEKEALRKYIDDVENIIQQQNALYTEKIKELGGEW